MQYSMTPSAFVYILIGCYVTFDTLEYDKLCGGLACGSISLKIESSLTLTPVSNFYIYLANASLFFIINISSLYSYVKFYIS
jgi:hypothetical protein